MCIYPRLILNRKYTATKKNKGIIPKITDERVKYVSIGCGKCIECTKKKAREWKIRLSEEIRTNNSGTFVTLTFDEDSLNKFKEEFKESHEQTIENEIATRAVRLFLERWRKSYKKSLKHWLITEKGHENTKRIHLHGIIFTKNIEAIKKHWKYGWVYIGEYVNEKTISYITKYVTKIDEQNKWFTGKILTSPGIGANYINRPDSKNNRYQEKTNELYINRSGIKTPIPIYYRNKIYSEEEREKLWCEKLDKQIRYVLGTKIDISTPEGEKLYDQMILEARQKNKRLGYGSISWDAYKYKKTCKKLKKPKKNIKIKEKIVISHNNIDLNGFNQNNEFK